MSHSEFNNDALNLLAELKKKADEAEAQAAKEREEKYFRFTVLASQLNRMEMSRPAVLKMFLKATSAIVRIHMY